MRYMRHHIPYLCPLPGGLHWVYYACCPGKLICYPGTYHITNRRKAWMPRGATTTVTTAHSIREVLDGIRSC